MTSDYDHDRFTVSRNKQKAVIVSGHSKKYE